jgi:YVTN family beta-propeller protein
VANWYSETISVIDGKTDSVIWNGTNVGLLPADIAVNTNTDKIYVANAGSNTVSVIDGSSLKNIKNLIAPQEARMDQSTNMIVSAETNQIYVSSYLRNEFFVINIEASSKFMQQNRATIFNGGPVSMAFDPNNSIIYTANVFLILHILQMKKTFQI